MADRFDLVAIVDWSAAGAPTSASDRSDAIWVGTTSDSAEEQQHFRTRAAAEVHIRRLIDRALASGRRALVGFDFAFGYPRGFAARLTGAAQAETVWRWLDDKITDGSDNRNNRFDVANQINAIFGGPGPFWRHPTGQSYPYLPFRKQGINYAALGVGEYRLTESLAKGAKSPWMLYNPGAVGSQSLLGLPMIHRLAQMPGVGVWPFSMADAPVVLAEVYPSLLGRMVTDMAKAQKIEKDRAQVLLLGRALFQLGARNQLSRLFQSAPSLAAEEGWILGAGHQDLLLQALQ